MGASFLLRECKKDGGMNVEAQTEREVWSGKAGTRVCSCGVSLPHGCSCLHQWGWAVSVQPSYWK